jgi:AmiR/NasT family two-component response regulator
MISVQLGVGIAEAFSRLRARAFAQGRPLSELAADVVARRRRFDPDHTV